MDIEKKYVQDVYTIIAPHFDVTRTGYIWSKIGKFILSLKPNSLIADIGCGNGKNMQIRKDCFFTGCDITKEFAQICNKKHLDIGIADNLHLPYRDNLFDSVISIAVVHHFATPERRLLAIKELIRILRPNGLLFIQVWSFDEKKYKSQDTMVPWTYRVKDEKHNVFVRNGQIFQRYYHLFIENELQELIKECHNTKIVLFGNDADNWYCIVQKE
jgi:tRNA (uracil-5-)-methyltransferase TRM9